MASIEERRGRYRAVVRVPGGGKISKTFDFEHEAKRWADELETPPVAATEAPTVLELIVRADGPTVAAHAAAWLEKLDTGDDGQALVEVATLKNYGMAVRAIQASPLANLAIADLRKTHVEAWIRDLSRASSKLGASSIRLRIKILRMIVRDALDAELCLRDATQGVRLPTQGKPKDRILTDAEEVEIRKAIEADGDAELLAFTLLGLDAGMRWSEVAGLHAEDVDLEAGTIHVLNVVTRELTIRPYTKDHSDRTIPILTEQLLEALRAIMPESGEGLLFPSEDGGPLDYPNHRKRSWQPLMRRAKIKASTTVIAGKRVTTRPGFHSLRHTLGTRLAQGSMPRSEIAAMLGHADERTTARYIHTREVEALKASGTDALARRKRAA